MEVTYHAIPKKPTTSTKSGSLNIRDKGMANDSKSKPSKPDTKPAKK